MPRTLHVVPHTHWDREWYLPFQSFRIRLVHLMDRLLDILDRDGTYRHFMLDGQTILLEDYLEIRPERAKEIAQFVRLGRLSIGPWHVLPDEFLVAPESLVRNLILGDHVCSRFGNKMRVGYVPDQFGHVSQLPQILRGFGIETIAFRRGLDEEPAELWWDAPDGSRVLVCYLRDGYDNAGHLPTTEPDAFVDAIRGARDSLAPFVASRHLLLLAGTDHQEPQPELPALIAYASDGRLDGDRLIHSSLPAYVEAVREAVAGKTLATVAGELRSSRRHHLLPGVLSARVWIKQRNDAVETLLTRWVEPYAAWAELLDLTAGPASKGERSPRSGHKASRRSRQSGALIWRAWRLLMENHPHDSICGCSVDQVHREMVSRFDQAEQIGEVITAQSLTTIADQVDTLPPEPSGEWLGKTQPLVVFNPTSGPRTDVVAARLPLPGAPDAIEVIGPDGERVPHQIVSDPAGAAADVVFLAPDLPAYGYAAFFVRAAGRTARGDHRGPYAGRSLENDQWRVEADLADGTLTLTDKSRGFVYAGLNRFVDGGDRGDEYNYCQPEEDQMIRQPVAPPSIRVIEDGPSRQTLEILQVYRLPAALRPDRRRRSDEMVDVTLISRVSLCPSLRRVDIETTVDNEAKDHRLRVHFPVPVDVDHAHTEAHYHVARRPIPSVPAGLDTSDWIEQPPLTVPQRGWADVSNGHVGLMVANRGLPEVEFLQENDRTVIGLTLLRCVGWLSRDDMHCRQEHAGPGLPTPEAQCIGRFTFQYTLIPHSGDWKGVRAEADAFRSPLRAVAVGIQEGSLPPSASLIEVEPSAFALTAIKQLKEGSGSGLLVRGVNLSDRPNTLRLRPWRGFDQIARVNLNEEFVEPLLAATDGAVTVRARPWEIVTVRWRDA